MKTVEIRLLDFVDISQKNPPLFINQHCETEQTLSPGGPPGLTFSLSIELEGVHGPNGRAGARGRSGCFLKSTLIPNFSTSLPRRKHQLSVAFRHCAPTRFRTLPARKRSLSEITSVSHTGALGGDPMIEMVCAKPRSSQGSTSLESMFERAPQKNP